ncbi:MAG: c-type cytochrome [Pseudomonadales bacterium]
MFRYLLTALVVMVFPISVHAVPAGTDEEILERIKPVGELCLQGQSCTGKIEPTPAGAAPAIGPAPEVDAAPMRTAAEAPAASGRSGEEVYSSSCFACHDAAIAGAPLFGDAVQWQPRIAKGMDALLKSSIDGILPLMPPRGACMDCSDDELAAAVTYMVDAAR